MQNTPDQILNSWGLQLLEKVAQTGQAVVWKVKVADSFAALKLYDRPDRGNESPGTGLMADWQDRGAVRILREAPSADLMEWLDGPTLGHIARAGQPQTALIHLANVAQRLHQAPRVTTPGLTPLQKVFAPLLSCSFAPDCPNTLRKNIEKAQNLTRHLLGSQRDIAPLHGDLHPDNILLTESGPRVIDAKGYLGDRAFELANALRHPKGMADLVRQPEQIDACLTLYSTKVNVSRQRLAQWAATKCALSIYWRSGPTVSDDREADLLDMFLSATGQ